MLQLSSRTAGPQDEGSRSQSSDENDQMLAKAPRTSLKSWDHSSPSATLTGEEDKNEGCLLQMGGRRRPLLPSARSSSPPLHHLTSTTTSRHIRHPTTADKVPSAGPLLLITIPITGTYCNNPHSSRKLSPGATFNRPGNHTHVSPTLRHSFGAAAWTEGRSMESELTLQQIKTR